jgi:hypothetical protein
VGIGGMPNVGGGAVGEGTTGGRGTGVGVLGGNGVHIGQGVGVGGRRSGGVGVGTGFLAAAAMLTAATAKATIRPIISHRICRRRI